MRQGALGRIAWLRRNSPRLAFLFAAVSIAVFAPPIVRADSPALPLYEGATTFPQISGPADPEEYSWRVELAEGEELESVDEQRAEVYFVEGHHPAFGISAEPAHDADGSTVPTNLSVSAGDVITLTVHHRAGDPLAGGAPFDYPVVAGQGWKGGFVSETVIMPPPETPAGQEAAPQFWPRSSSCCRRTQARGQVGGAPTIPLGRPDEGERLTPDFVIGRGRTYRGAVELAAYGWLAPRDSVPSSPRKQLCVWVEYLPDEVNPGTCNRALDSESEGKVAIDDRIQALGPGRYTEIGGRLAPEVVSVQVSYPHDGNKLAVINATIGRVIGDLQRKLHQPAPLAYFDARVPGTIHFGAIRVDAFDRFGNLIGESHG